MAAIPYKVFFGLCVYMMTVVCYVKGTEEDLCQYNLHSNMCQPCGGGRLQTSAVVSGQNAIQMTELKMYFYGKLTDLRLALNNTMRRYEHTITANEWTYVRNFSFDDIPVIEVDFDELPETTHSALRMYDSLSMISLYMKLTALPYARIHGLHSRNHEIQSHTSSALCFLKRITARLDIQVPRNACRKRIAIEETENVVEFASWVYAIVKQCTQTLDDVISRFLSEEMNWQ